MRCIWVTNYIRHRICVYESRTTSSCLLLKSDSMFGMFCCSCVWIWVTNDLRESRTVFIRVTNYEQLLVSAEVAEEQQHIWCVLLFMCVYMSNEVSTWVTKYVYACSVLHMCVHETPTIYMSHGICVYESRTTSNCLLLKNDSIFGVFGCWCVCVSHELSTWVTDYVCTSHELREAACCCSRSSRATACFVAHV